MPEERKLVSLVFADVVGSTAWGAQQDPEVVRRSMARYFARMKDIAETHGGTVEKFIGDAVMVVFGVPQLHEDDAERAVRTALAMRDAIADLNRELGIALAVRIAVNSGDVVTGGGEEQRQFLVTGDAVNVVARLQAGAEPDEVVVGALTERLTRDSIEYEARDPIVAKGKPEPVPAFRALRARSSVPVSHGGAPTLPAALVGRKRELRQILDSVERATDERTGYLVTVVGNAGVGKSRLVTEVMARLAQREGVRILRGRCLAYGAGITYWPLMDVVREDAGITSSDDRGAVLGKLSTRLATLFSGDRLPAVQARIALLLGLEPAPAVLPNVSAERIAVELSWGIRQYLEAIAAHETLVVVIDDLQWADPAVLEVLGQVADRSSTVPVLLVCIARPELLERSPSWAASRSNASLVHLEPLDEADTRTLLSGLLATSDVPQPVASLIAERSAGNPLFCEEFLRMLIDAGYLEFADGRWKARRSLGDLPLPESIQSIVAARLDGLPPTEKITFQRASVIGEHFALDELLALDGEMGVAPEALVRKGLFVADRDDPSGRSLRFKHLLIRDVAYGSLSKADRATLHDRVGALLEAGKADRRDEFSELLAFHAAQSYLLSRELRLEPETLAPRSARVLRCSTVAGDRALALFATEQAVGHYALAIEIARDDEPMLGELQLRLAQAAFLAGTARRAVHAAEEARRWFEKRGDMRGAGLALTRVASYRWFLGETTGAREAAEDAARTLEPLGKSQELAGAYAQVARLAYLNWDYSVGAEWGQHAVDMAREQMAPSIEADSLITLGSMDAPLGRGVARLREGIDLASAHDLVETAMRGFHNLSVTLHMTGSSGAETRRVLEEMFAYAHLHHFRTSTLILDEAFYVFATGDWDAVLRLLEEAHGESLWTIQRRLLDAFIAVGRGGPERSLPLLDVPRRALHEVSASHKIFGAMLLGRVTLLAGDARATLEDLDGMAADIGRPSYPEVDEAVVCALTAAITQDDSVALARWIDVALADEAGARRVAGRARRAFAQAEHAANEADLDSAIRLLGESAKLFQQSFLPFGETLSRRRRIELLLRRNGAGDRDAAQAELAAILPYWRKAKATWYLGQLERWAADRGLAFSREGFGAHSIVASP
jgi:class 3 adenylate cyclase/ABC-type branched-subunit amino acid transport system ATPase component